MKKILKKVYQSSIRDFSSGGEYTIHESDSNQALVIDESKHLIIKIIEPVILANAAHFRLMNDDIKSVDMRTVIEFGDVDEYDSYLFLLISSLKRRFENRPENLIIAGMSSEMMNYLNMIDLKQSELSEFKSNQGAFFHNISEVGEHTKGFINSFVQLITFAGELFRKLILVLIKPSAVRWADFPYYFMSAGVNAVFIVLLILFLIGVITGYQGALQLKQFGADIYIADLIGVSITRELAPLMTAIIIAGRSGSAFAAEIGTMKISEELDALKSMGYDIMGFIVVPRVLAVTLVMPLITILADAAGIVGGMLTAMATLDISVASYINQLQKALSYSHIFSGLGKSVIFGFLVSATGCFRGLQVSGGAESVGKFTTSAVVTGILMIILSDAIFTFFFQTLGL